MNELESNKLHSYEIHSSVFLFKAHASGAIPPTRYAETTALITRFLAHLNTVTPDETHISTRYARLLQKLWFRQDQSAPEAHISDAQVDPSLSQTHSDGQFSYANNDSSDPSLNVNASGGSGLVGGMNLNTASSMLDDISLGSFDYMDTNASAVDWFLAMPPVFPYDLSMFFNGRSSGSGGLS